VLVLINLDSATERRARMTAQLQAQGRAARRIGIDLRGLERAAVSREVATRFASLRFDLRKLSGAEVGCWSSHLAAWQHLAASAQQAACVIEDDLVLAAEFAATVDVLLSDSSFDLVYLGTSSRNVSYRRRQSVGALSVHAPVGVIFNTWGYVVQRDWVQSFFATGGVIDLPIDHFLGGRARFCRPRIGVLQPAVVEEDPQLGRASQIAPHTRRIDRADLVEQLRRAVLGSRLGDLYYRTVYRVL
jgi:glycosyl transferase family 25